MAEIKLSLQHQTLNSLQYALDPKSLILSQFPDSNQPQILKLTSDSFTMERGARYKEYSDLRNKRLRMKNQTPEKNNTFKRSVLTPPKKQVKFSSNFTTPPKKPKGSSILAQSVPNFSSALRKENRKPVMGLSPVPEKYVSPLKSGRMYGSKSENSVEKNKSGGVTDRKSCANFDELKEFGSFGAGNLINGENRVGGGMGRKSYASLEELRGFAAIGAASLMNGENRVGAARKIGRTILGSRQVY